MVVLGFVVDLPRLTSWSTLEVKEILLELAQVYASSTLFESSADKISLFKITDGMNLDVMYESSIAYFRLEQFKKAVTKLPNVAVAKEWESEISAGVLNKILSYEMGNPYTEKKIIIITSALPNLASSESKNVLMAAKDRCMSFEFLFADHQRVLANEKKETFQRSISEIDNCGMQYLPADRASLEHYVNSLSKKLNDDSGDLRHILFRLEDKTRDFNIVRQKFEVELGSNADVDVLSIYRITSPSVTARLKAFLGAENVQAQLTWFPAADMDEVHSVVINGFNPSGSHSNKFGPLH